MKRMVLKKTIALLLTQGAFTFGLLSSVSAYGQGLECSNLFRMIQYDVSIGSDWTNFKSKDLRYTSRHSKSSDESSVVVDGRARDQAGRSLFILKKTGDYWMSTYTPAPDNYQGDPRWFPILFGGRTAAHFGFKKINDTIMTAPTADTLNQTIQHLNVVLSKKGHEMIEIKFHESGMEAEEGVKFLRNFVSKTSLPIARSGHYAVHDISYHALAILLPKVILDGARMRAEILLRLIDKVENNSTISPVVKKVVRKALNQSLEQLVRNIDFGTGNIGFILSMEKADQRDSFRRPYQAYDLKDTVIRHLVENSQELLESLKQKMMDTFASEILHVYRNPEDVKEYIPLDVSPAKRKALVTNIQNELSRISNDLVRGESRAIQNTRQEIRTEALVNFVRERIQSIQEADLTVESLSFAP